MHYIGIDTGGTFTDGVLVDADGGLATAKVPTTPADPSQGVASCIEKLAELRTVSAQGLLSETQQLAHGTTIGTNAVVERNGPRVALIATRGHGDAILMMRGTGRSEGLPPESVFDILGTDKPAPLVSPGMIFEVDERIDCLGQLVVELDDDSAREFAERVAEARPEAIAIALLWSFKNPRHELLLLEHLRRTCPDAYLSCSHRVSPTVGEYERTVATVVNAYVGQRTSDYIGKMDTWLNSEGLAGEFLVLQCGGGVIPVADARELPLLTIGSGPVGGMVGSVNLARRLNIDDVIVTDMGGTSFEVGLIVDGQPLARDHNVLHQYKYWVPQVDLVSIGSGGGSIAWLDESTGSLRVGPRSASAVPGPACYQRGGEFPTVTDADLILGFLRPDAFLGGEMELDVNAAERVVGDLGARLGLTCEQTALAIRKIVDVQMASIIRRQTLARGLDPRGFTLLAYGGAGPLHAAAYSAELGCEQVIIPAGNAASVWSAFGAAVSELLQIVEADALLQMPVAPERLTEVFAEIEARIETRFESNGDGVRPRIDRAIKLRYRGQLNRVEVPVPSGELTTEDVSEALRAFEREYERLFGEGSTTNQPIEITTVRCSVYGRPREPMPMRSTSETVGSPLQAQVEERAVWWPETDGREQTPFYDGQSVPVDEQIDGPAVVTLPFTSIVVPRAAVASRDQWGNFKLKVGGSAAGGSGKGA